jgi:hypothetical protein
MNVVFKKGGFADDDDDDEYSLENTKSQLK